MSTAKKLRSDSSCSEHLQDIDFTRKSCWTDLQLKVEGAELYVPKSHLAMISPVFRLMFESDFKEQDLNVLPLPGKKYADVLLFLQCTHPGTRLKITCKLYE
ncbi:hypothetical protein ACJMK2_028234 [Sinanodonta woodiana]|uniref:BTB domain-containing protein n=1 Tax=Sinanodonta woodiana TaxID=1069815 RepID=A0ABD3X9Z7_SINWO